jgi:hypothetical protein
VGLLGHLEALRVASMSFGLLRPARNGFRRNKSRESGWLAEEAGRRLARSGGLIPSLFAGEVRMAKLLFPKPWFGCGSEYYVCMMELRCIKGW